MFFNEDIYHSQVIVLEEDMNIASLRYNCQVTDLTSNVSFISKLLLFIFESFLPLNILIGTYPALITYFSIILKFSRRFKFQHPLALYSHCFVERQADIETSRIRLYAALRITPG